ncbi:hypothetical protein QVD17_24909 [Tagetes erecta]|uniref:RBR-type E3 ubiquitin transferase n=1 Tax=Tagetes erecta TaxID=13708 RepID=A0AAD8KJ39_TARER|nr:hypothetical protein QVD17_24909 [Tagetes erecta]
MQYMDTDPLFQPTFTTYSDDRFYSDNNFNFTADDYDSDVDDGADDYNVLVNRVNCSTEKCYAILEENDLIQRQQEDITQVASVLSIPRDYACMLLICYNWSVANVHEAWFDDEDKVRKRVGLLDVDPDVKFPKSDENYEIFVDCGICFESVRVCDTATCGCDHKFCKVCWKGYICSGISDGPGCLSLRCPEPRCDAAVGPDMVNALVSDLEKKRYEMFMLRTYVECNKKIKWCPGPGCDYAVQFDDDFETGSYDVVCLCEYGFCWKCMEDAHRPLGCETVGKWVMKNSTEAESTNWIFAYTKACPKCKRAIEKNNGCMHMTCSPPCGYEFCWLCLGSYKGHDGRACNRFTQQNGPVLEAEREREMAKKAIERYTHYYERWAANEMSRKQAVAALNKIETFYLKKLSLTYCQPDTQLRFIKDAWLQIVECRRVLKWTYAYGYYLPKVEHAKRLFFEYVQGEAEAGLEKLHRCAEKELKIYITDDEATEEQFNMFRVKLAGLTSVTRAYFENLVRALENGLSEVDSHETCSKSSSGQDAGGVSSSKVRGRKRSGQGSELSNRVLDSSKRLRMMMMRRAMDEARRNATRAAGESSSRDHLGDQDN